MGNTCQSLHQFFGSLLNQANFPQEESTVLQNKLMYILVCRTYPQICDSLTPHQDQTLKMTCRLFLTNPNQAAQELDQFTQETLPQHNLTQLILKEAQTMVDDLTQVFSRHLKTSDADSLKQKFHSLTQ